MNLYRFDFQHPDGTSEPVTDFLGTVLMRSRFAANDRGRFLAQSRSVNVQLSRIQGAGRVTVMGVFQRDSGTFKAAAK